MDFLNIFTWIVLLITIATVLGVFVFMGLWPGKVAQANNHPQAEAIQVASWLALIFGIVAWPFVLVWAYTQPVSIRVSEGGEVETGQDIMNKITVLEARVAQLEADKGDTQ